ncbi:nitroreductase family protein, partial [Salmonella enterica subsp. enterica serovar Kentucky]|nr:nitroreductase family protein [Salmonella enterica subsp. enterica serovar Kentucky]
MDSASPGSRFRRRRHELLCGHRSIRHFTDEPVTDAQREAIIAAARSTSSSSFLQCSS